MEQLVVKSGRSRNELINKALKFALDNVEFVDKQKHSLLESTSKYSLVDFSDFLSKHTRL